MACDAPYLQNTDLHAELVSLPLAARRTEEEPKLDLHWQNILHGAGFEH